MRGFSRNKSNLLDTIPCRSSHILTEREGDAIVLAFPRFKRAWMQRFLLPRGMSPFIRVRLEAHGAAVWEAIDGQSTVRDIIGQLFVHFEGEADYASRVATYLYQLEKDGFIFLQLPVSTK